MKNLFNSFLRISVRIALHLYYQKVTVYGKENIPKGKAVLIVCNHQNALIDPLLIATHTRLKPHFLTRASVFKNPIIAKILDYIRMIPVYRIRDGVDNMEKNKHTFSKSVQILHDKGSILIFGEGGHSMKRTLRPLKKGFARIAYQALESKQDLDLMILPVGINYSAHSRSGSYVSIYFGEAFPAAEFYPKYDTLMKETLKRMDPLISQVPEDNYETNLSKLIQERIPLTNPQLVKRAVDGGSLLEEEKVKTPESTPIANFLMKLFIFPLYLIWKKFQPKIKDKTFYATFKFVIPYGGFPVLFIISLFLASLNYNYSIILLIYWLMTFILILSNKNGQT
ncbi:MAG: acyl-phosphate glycerol 3-phosphate acyltransferase [Mongoliibacter sp.]|uniref:lysophospholipid acyltransferase family protein n=1 Tax=Mongoliibacter sp. TaxID=2022438 RepID=UPI0012F3A8AB|nr:lysophospholipid acyltransferase family protein [Mongoliibacter sp.]TVP43149.1 MAG: acyl-phosphate glycerol 3-phosphate acyltransferase [Mongoliibacter sp.]